MPDEAVHVAMHPCPVGRKWNYRKRRSIHERRRPRETLIAPYPAKARRKARDLAVGRTFGSVFEAALSSLTRVCLIFNEVSG